MIKIYSDDPNLPFKTTKLKALYTKAEIDGLFAKWGIKDVYWRWDPEHNDVFILFKFTETIEDRPIESSFRIEAPIIWDHKTRKGAETVNWNISMRVLYWFLYTHLAAAYLRQSSKTAAFLPYMTTRDETTTLEKVLLPRLDQLNQLKALTNSKPLHDESRVIDPEEVQ